MHIYYLFVQNWRLELNLYFCSEYFEFQSVGLVEKYTEARIGPWRDLVGCQYRRKPGRLQFLMSKLRQIILYSTE